MEGEERDQDVLFAWPHLLMCWRRDHQVFQNHHLALLLIACWALEAIIGPTLVVLVLVIDTIDQEVDKISVGVVKEVHRMMS
jgi:hypothetical protein